MVDRQNYVRFVISELDRDSGKRRGVFQAAFNLVDAGQLFPHEHEELQATLDWFGKHLDAPDRFTRSRRKDAEGKAIGWYKSGATEYINRMHTICRILKEHEIITEMITSTRPGYIVFEDDHQVAAVPFADTIT